MAKRQIEADERYLIVVQVRWRSEQLYRATKKKAWFKVEINARDKKTEGSYSWQSLLAATRAVICGLRRCMGRLKISEGDLSRLI